MHIVDLRRNRGGFTLVELVVALLIGTILVAVLFQLMSGQVRISAVQSGREEAQQNSRGALEVLSSELRSAMPGALVDARAQSLTYFRPTAWGLLCGPIAGATTFNVVFPQTGATAPWNAATGNGILLQNGNAWIPDPAQFPARARITASQVLGAPTAANCPLGPQGPVVVVNFTSSLALTAGQGTLVATYAATRYDIGDAQGRQWVRRSNGMNPDGSFSMQPLAGPVEADRFLIAYFDANGNALGIPGNNPAALGNVSQVRVQVVTNSTQRINGIVQRDSGMSTVTLRN
jgi:prepilin-type N-terminal cleavage/methylation domain-containing protein